MKITEALFAEHQLFHTLFDYIERTAPTLKTVAEVKSLAAMMEALLEAHSRTEDQLFIGPLEHCFEQLGQSETFHQEHAEIDASLKLALAAKRLLQARQSLLTAVAASRKHFDKEERIVFPLAERVLSEKTLATLGQTWAEQRTRWVANSKNS
jgi:hemerythrin-like domain-containing protein